MRKWYFASNLPHVTFHVYTFFRTKLWHFTLLDLKDVSFKWANLNRSK